MRRQFTDIQLIELLKSQDRKAFEYLHSQYSSALLNVTFRIVRQADVAADLLQDSFVKIWKNFHRFDKKKGTLFTWMLNVTRNTAIDYLRARQTVDIATNIEALQEAELVSFAALNLQTLEYTELQFFVDSLPVKCSTVIKLIYFQGYTVDEAAIELSIPLGTVKSRLRKGLMELRQTYDQAGFVGVAA